MPRAKNSNLVGKKIGRYDILAEIGSGGVGIVYQARDPDLDVMRAIKVLRPELTADTELADSFVTEARMGARLNNPHVVTIYETGKTEDGRPFIVMEYVAAQSLTDLVREEGALPLLRVARIIKQLAAALDTFHQAGLVHQDVKPDNIMIRPGDDVMLTDYGMTRAAGARLVSDSGRFYGTPAYMAPEQVRNQATTPLSDIYCLGLVAYKMVTGRHPFGADTLSPDRFHAVLHSQAYDQPPPASSLRPELPRPLDAVLARALAKAPSARFATAHAFSEALASAVGGDTRPALPTTPAQPIERRLARVPTGAAAGLGTLSALALVGLFAFGANRFITQPERVAKATAAAEADRTYGGTATAVWLKLVRLMSATPPATGPTADIARDRATAEAQVAAAQAASDAAGTATLVAFNRAQQAKQSTSTRRAAATRRPTARPQPTETAVPTSAPVVEEPGDGGGGGGGGSDGGGSGDGGSEPPEIPPAPPGEGGG